MSDPVELAAERLADALLDAILAVLHTKGFYPNERVKEALYELLRNNIGLGQ